MYQIFLTPKNTNFKPHFWTEGGLFESFEKANFHAKQIKKTKDYSKIQILKN